MGTGFDAVPATYAGRTIRMIEHIDIQFTHPLAHSAAGALFFVDAEAVEGDGIEVTVDRPQGAQISAERAVDKD